MSEANTQAVQAAIDRAERVFSLKAYNIEDFLKLDIPRRENILTPILQTQSLSMLFAQRGVGKTHVALGMAYAIASGGKFLKWEAQQPRKVLYLDGEMPASSMQERLARIIKESEKEASPDHFRLITPDMQDFGMPDISTESGQEALSPFIKDADFIVVDNISTLARTGRENEAEGWLPMQGWALRMRSSGKSVMFVHHAGKSGQQRGTSRREDVLDLVMELKRPANYKTEEGARFEVHLSKARNLSGTDAQPFEAHLMHGGWTFGCIEDAEIKKVLELKAGGLTIRDIAKEIGISKSKTHRLLKVDNA